MFHFDRVLKEGEKIVWAGTPRLGPYLLSGTLLLYLFIAFGLALIMAALFAPAYQGTSASDAYNRLFFTVAVFLASNQTSPPRTILT